MTTEQLAIIVPAIVAMVTVWIIARTQTRINRQTLESQRRLAQQERARAAYEDMLHMVGWVMEIVSATKPILERSEPPQEPDTERVRSAQARIEVHGSPEVKAILRRWAERRNEFFGAAWLLDRMQDDEQQRGVDVDKSYGQPLVEQWKKVDDIRKELHEMVRELADTANAEMRA
jgi:hypothetical protein